MIKRARQLHRDALLDTDIIINENVTSCIRCSCIGTSRCIITIIILHNRYWKIAFIFFKFLLIILIFKILGAGWGRGRLHTSDRGPFRYIVILEKDARGEGRETGTIATFLGGRLTWSRSVPLFEICNVFIKVQILQTVLKEAISCFSRTMTHARIRNDNVISVSGKFHNEKQKNIKCINDRRYTVSYFYLTLTIIFMSFAHIIFHKTFVTINWFDLILLILCIFWWFKKDSIEIFNRRYILQ